jgi:hypothetical protein
MEKRDPSRPKISTPALKLALSKVMNTIEYMRIGDNDIALAETHKFTI